MPAMAGIGKYLASGAKNSMMPNRKKAEKTAASGVLAPLA